MPIQNVVTPGNLGNEFDVGVEEANKIHVMLGDGVWRETDGRIVSIPWQPEERWVKLAASGVLVEDFEANQPADINNLLGGGTSLYTFATVPGLTSLFDTTGSNITTVGSAVGDLLILSNAGYSRLSMPFSQMLQIDSLTFTLGGSTDLTVTSLGGEALDIVSSTFESSSGSGTDMLIGTATTINPHSMTISSMGLVSGILIEAQNNGGGTQTNAAIRLGSMTFQATSIDAIYTLQRYADGTLVAVNDADMTDILTATDSMMMLYDDRPLNNFMAMTLPNVNNDETEGFGRGSRWNDGNSEYVCMDATAGAAVWTIIT